jgi:hypothetical protein
MWGCHHFLNLHSRHSPAKLFAVDLIAIPQQKARSSVFRKCLDNLLRSPSSRWMFGHVEMHHASSMMSKHHQYKQHAKGRRRDNQEIIEISSLR